MTLATWITSQDNYCCLENEPFTRIESVVWQVLLRCVTSQKRTSIFRECLQLRPPMTTPWPLVELVALPLHLRLDRFEHLINFSLSLFLPLLVFKALFSDVPWLAWKGGSSSSSRLISCTTGVRENFYVAAQAFTSFATCFYGEEKRQW